MSARPIVNAGESGFKGLIANGKFLRTQSATPRRPRCSRSGSGAKYNFRNRVARGSALCSSWASTRAGLPKARWRHGGRMRFAKPLLPLLYLVPALCFGQASSIEIVATGDDPMGKTLVTAIRERIRALPSSMSITTKRDVPRLVVSVVTLDPAPPNGVQTIYSVTFIYDGAPGPLAGVYLGNSVGLCSPERTQTCADSIVAELESQIDLVRQTRLPLR